METSFQKTAQQKKQIGLKNEANDLSRWNLRSIVGHKKNRLVSYPCSYFHSKYPNEFKQSRVVFVMFYK